MKILHELLSKFVTQKETHILTQILHALDLKIKTKIINSTMPFFTDRFVLEGPDVTQELWTDLEKLNTLLNITDEIAGTFTNNLFSLEYDQLNESQKQVFDLTSKILQKIRNTDSITKSLFPSTQPVIPRSQWKHNPSNIEVIKTETIKIESGERVTMSVETQSELKAVKGQLESIKLEITYFKCHECKHLMDDKKFLTYMQKQKIFNKFRRLRREFNL